MAQGKRDAYFVKLGYWVCRFGVRGSIRGFYKGLERSYGPLNLGLPDGGYKFLSVPAGASCFSKWSRKAFVPRNLLERFNHNGAIRGLRFLQELDKGS